METGMRAALDGHLRRVLKPLLWALAGIYAALSFLWLMGVRADVPGAVAAMWAATALLAASEAVAVASPRVPARWAHPMLAAIVLAAYNNALWLITLSRDFVYTPVLYLILLGSAVLFLSVPAFVLTASLGIAAWVGIAVAFGAADVAVKWGFTLFAALVIACVTQVVRVRTFVRLEGLRQREVEGARREAELVAARQQAAERTRLLNLTAHEIATPLTPLLVHLHALGAEADRLSPAGQAALRSLERNANRLHGAMQDVLAAVGPPHEGTRTPHDLQALLDEAVRGARKVARCTVRVVPGPSAGILVDAEAVRLAVRLAVRRLVQAADRRLSEAGVVEVAARLADGQLEVRVADEGAPVRSGRGAGVQRSREAYDPLGPHEDLGLGVHLAQRHVEAAGGRLRHEDGVAGPVFVFTLPAT